jgi:hypothetical protein
VTDFVIDGQRRPKDKPLEDIVFRLHPLPLVRIIEGEAAESEWRAWADTQADELGMT